MIIFAAVYSFTSNMGGSIVFFFSWISGPKVTLNHPGCDLLHNTGQRISTLIEPNNFHLTKASLPKTHPDLI